MRCLPKCCVLILAVTIAAVALRGRRRLEKRPMHCDEAVHACKFGELLEEGFYRYDPYEYHGPTLNYLSLIPAWLESIHTYQGLNERTLRMVPVFFGVLLVFLFLLLGDGLGWRAAIFGSVLTAVSPAMVYYSRYYIQEMLLVCFSFGAIVCGYRYKQGKTVGWALLTGMFLGLMHATKETCIIVFSSMLLALGLTLLMRRRRGGSEGGGLRAINIRHVLAGFAMAGVVSILFFSSFLSNPEGVLDSIGTYGTYLDRAGQNELHIHPWYYYLKMLIYWQNGRGPAWSEGLIIFLAGAGFIVSLRRKGLTDLTVNQSLLRFIAFYTAFMTVFYALIPYKTPWCLLGFLHGMILLAGVGAEAIIRLPSRVWSRVLIGALLVVGTAHLGWQGYQGSYKYGADPRNPYVYAHTSTDVYEMVEGLEDFAQVHPEGHNIHIQIISTENLWPLPWYLRGFSYVRWWNMVSEDAPMAPIIIVSPGEESALARKIYELTPLEEREMYMYMFEKPYYLELRPQVKLYGYVVKSLWDRYQQHGLKSIEAEIRTKQ